LDKSFKVTTEWKMMKHSSNVPEAQNNYFTSNIESKRIDAANALERGGEMPTKNKFDYAN
jgi:hypothetical protein